MVPPDLFPGTFQIVITGVWFGVIYSFFHYHDNYLYPSNDYKDHIYNEEHKDENIYESCEIYDCNMIENEFELSEIYL